MATVTAATAMATATARSPRNDLASIKLRVSQKRGAHQPQTLTHLLPTTERTDKTSQALWCLEGSHIISIRKHSGAWKAVRHRTDYSSFNTDWNGLNGLDGWDLFPFPRLTPLQPGGDVHPCKRACLPEPPHLSGLPLSDGKKSSHGCFPEDMESVRLLLNVSPRTGVAFVITVLL